jgi:hypothetical protein
MLYYIVKEIKKKLSINKFSVFLEKMTLLIEGFALSIENRIEQPFRRRKNGGVSIPFLEEF